MSENNCEKEVFKKIKLISNPKRFAILINTQRQQLSIIELSKMLKLAYNKCADYVTMLEKDNLVEKTKEGKEVKVASKVKIFDNKIEF